MNRDFLNRQMVRARAREKRRELYRRVFPYSFLIKNSTVALTDEMVKWCEETIGDCRQKGSRWRFCDLNMGYDKVLYFENSKDAAMFRLRWGL